jgi:hypothetical protein
MHGTRCLLTSACEKTNSQGCTHACLYLGLSALGHCHQAKRQQLLHLGAFFRAHTTLACLRASLLRVVILVALALGLCRRAPMSGGLARARVCHAGKKDVVQCVRKADMHMEDTATAAGAGFVFRMSSCQKACTWSHGFLSCVPESVYVAMYVCAYVYVYASTSHMPTRKKTLTHTHTHTHTHTRARAHTHEKVRAHIEARAHLFWARLVWRIDVAT